jgi:hypothetical protein
MNPDSQDPAHADKCLSQAWAGTSHFPTELISTNDHAVAGTRKAMYPKLRSTLRHSAV